MSNSSFIGQAHSFIFFSLQRLVEILSTRDPMTGDLLFTVTNGIDRVKSGERAGKETGLRDPLYPALDVTVTTTKKCTSCILK